MREADDKTLVAAALIGSFAAFDELIRRYRAGVILTAQQVLGNRCAAEDVAQETFLTAFKALPQLEEPERFAGWLRAIARNRALRVSEKERRSEPHEPSRLDRLILAGDGMGNHSPSDPVREWERAADREALRAALTCLSPELRVSLELHYGEEWSIERIAAFLSLPESTIRGRLYRARAALRRTLVQAVKDKSQK